MRNRRQAPPISGDPPNRGAAANGFSLSGVCNAARHVSGSAADLPSDGKRDERVSRRRSPWPGSSNGHFERESCRIRGQPVTHDVARG